MLKNSLTHKQFRIIISALLMFSFTGHAHAGILGKKLISISAGKTTPGDKDMKKTMDKLDTKSINLQLPLNNNIEILLGYSEEKTELDSFEYNPDYNYYYYQKSDIKMASFQANLLYQFAPGNTINPFVDIGLQKGRATSESTIVDMYYNSFESSFAEEDSSSIMGGGAEFSFGNGASLITSLDYVSDLFGEDDTLAAVSLNLLASQSFLFAINTGYALDERDKSISITLGMGF